MILTKLSTWIRERFVRVETKAQPAVSLPMPSVSFVKPPEPVREAERPRSAVAILRDEPNLRPEELAARAGVTLSYARSLIRRQQAKPLTASIRPAIVDGNVARLQGQVRELNRRLQQTETRLQPPTGQARRTEVLDRSAAGIGGVAIAEELAVAEGEVDFILKIERLKKSLKN